MCLDKYVKISKETLGLVNIHSIEKKKKKKKKKKKIIIKNVYCHKRSDEAGMYSVTGRVGIPATNADAAALVLEFANGTN